MNQNYELLMYNPKWLSFLIQKLPPNVWFKIYLFYSAFPRFRDAILVWWALMTTDYKISSRKTFGLTWFDEFYSLLNPIDDQRVSN